jgi:hypothetical protein
LIVVSSHVVVPFGVTFARVEGECRPDDH